MIREAYPDVVLIGGGGVRSIEDAKQYLNAGADHISVSTLCFNPVRFAWFYWNWKK
jgi:dihydroorotate dehydrogenase